MDPDPDPGGPKTCGSFSGSGSPNQDSDPGFGYGMNIPDHISESLETIFGLKILKFFDMDPDPGSGIFLTLDRG
jgi:hypothetical protein